MRKFIIHLLGGVTKRQCEKVALTSAMTARAMVTQNILAEAKNLYKTPAEEWAKKMYEYIEFKYQTAPDVDIHWEGRSMCLTIDELNPEDIEEEESNE